MAQLAPDISGALNTLLQTFGTKQSREKEEEERQRQADIETQIDILSAGESGVETGTGQPGGRGQSRAQAALLRLSALSPTLANSVRQTLERGDRQELLQAQQETQKGVREALVIQRAPTHKDRVIALRRMAHEKAAGGEDVNRIIELSNLAPAQLELELDKMVLQGADIDLLTKEALKPRQETFAPLLGEGGAVIGQQSSLSGRVFTDPRSAPGAVQETFETLTDDQGNVTGQRSLLTGKVISDPRTPKPATKTTLEKNLDAAGITDPAERKEIIVKSITKPGVKIDINEGLSGFKVPKGFMFDKDETGKIIGIKPIPGGKADRLGAGDAAKVQMLRTAQKAAKGIRELIFDKFDKKGVGIELDRMNLFNAEFNTAFSDGRKLRNKMEFGIQGITRFETGAAMPPAEVDNTRIRFTPNIFDTPEIARLKLEMFDDFMSGTLQLIDPSGRFNEDRFGNPVKPTFDKSGNAVELGEFNESKFDAELQRRLSGTAQTGETENVIRFDALGNRL